MPKSVLFDGYCETRDGSSTGKVSVEDGGSRFKVPLMAAGSSFRFGYRLEDLVRERQLASSGPSTISACGGCWAIPCPGPVGAIVPAPNQCRRSGGAVRGFS